MGAGRRWVRRVIRRLISAKLRGMSWEDPFLHFPCPALGNGNGDGNAHGGNAHGRKRHPHGGNDHGGNDHGTETGTAETTRGNGNGGNGNGHGGNGNGGNGNGNGGNGNGNGNRSGHGDGSADDGESGQAGRRLIRSHGQQRRRAARSDRPPRASDDATLRYVRRLAASIRVRIVVGYLVLLIAVALTVTIVIARQVQAARIDREVESGLVQEAQEFRASPGAAGSTSGRCSTSSSTAT